MVTVYLAHYVAPFKVKEADDFYFREGILHVTKGKGNTCERVAAYPQAGVMGVERTDCCCQS